MTTEHLTKLELFNAYILKQLKEQPELNLKQHREDAIVFGMSLGFDIDVMYRRPCRECGKFADRIVLGMCAYCYNLHWLKKNANDYKPKITDELTVKILRMYKDGWPTRMIASHVEKSQTLIYRVLKHAGVQMSQGNYRNKIIANRKTA